jgi:FkbM family methyltransferase
MSLRGALKRTLAGAIPERLWTRMLQRYYFKRLKAYWQAGEWESMESDLQIVRHLVSPGDSVVDVGANFGFYTAYLSGLVGQTGHVTSFEPIPLTFDILAYNGRKLPLTNLTAFNYAISDGNRSAVMNVPRFDSGSDNYYQARLVRSEADRADSSGRSVAVQVRTLDSVLRDSPDRVSFIKIDVEGHELPAVAGAQNLISSSKPALLIEVSGDPDDTESAAFALCARLRDDGYLPYWYDGSSLRRRSRGDVSINYFFLTEEQVSRLAAAVPVDVAERDRSRETVRGSGIGTNSPAAT